MSEFIPHGYQSQIITFIQRVKRCAVWAGMGLGKTVSTLTALDELDSVENIYPVLVVAPLRVARTTWPNEVHKWDHLRHIQIMPIVGSLGERRAALRAKVQVYTVNFEQLPWLVEYLNDK